MQIPGNLTAPRMKLTDGEAVLLAHNGLRRKGLFGNRYGELLVTNNRVAFVKAIAGGLIGAAASKLGVKPMLEFDRATITGAAKVSLKRQTLLVIHAGERSEKFMMDEAAVDAIVPLLAKS